MYPYRYLFFLAQTYDSQASPFGHVLSKMCHPVSQHFQVTIFDYQVAYDSQVTIFECREYRNNRSALFDGIEEGGIRASSSYSSHEIDEHDNDKAMDGLQDRVNMLKRVSSILGRKSNDLCTCEHFGQARM